MKFEPATAERVLVLASRARDVERGIALLQRFGLQATGCHSIDDLAEQLHAGAGCAMVEEECLSSRALDRLVPIISEQPPWSDFPWLVFSKPHGDTLEALGNVTLLPRPVQPRTLVSAVESALRARRRQYEAMRAIAQRDEFLAMLGHELRNPLGVVLMTTQTMEMKAAADDAMARERRIIDRQAKHLARLVDDLLDVSRVTSGKVLLQKDVLDLNEACESTVLSVRSAVAIGRRNVSVLRSPEPVPVLADPVRLDQIISNLLTNAIKYSPDDAEIVLAVRRVGESAQLHVRDSGFGIPPEKLGSVFELFSQLDRTIDRSRGGLGIGLTLVRSLVEQHGGQISAKSDGLGKGSEFVVTLPITHESAPAKRGVPPVEAPKRHHRVLVIEDNEDLRNSLRELLGMLGYDVEVAEDGNAGLQRALQVAPAAALVDIGLPGISGYQVAQGIRRSLGKDIFLVALSGYGQQSDRDKALEAGFDRHLTKPASVAALRSTLAALDNR